jgi:hypothetical protein
MRAFLPLGLGVVLMITATESFAETLDKSKISLQDKFLVIEVLSVQKDGWVVAHRSDNGQPGEIIGQASIRAGENKQVQVPITDLPKPGGSVIVILHQDAGTMGTFEPDLDKPLMNEGKPVMTEAKVE